MKYHQLNTHPQTDEVRLIQVTLPNSLLAPQAVTRQAAAFPSYALFSWVTSLLAELTCAASRQTQATVGRKEDWGKMRYWREVVMDGFPILS